MREPILAKTNLEKKVQLKLINMKQRKTSYIYPRGKIKHYEFILTLQ